MEVKEEIKLIDFFNILWDRKLKIILVGVLSSIFFINYALSIPPSFTARAIIKVSDSQATSTSLNSGLSGLASMAGISLGSTGTKTEDIVMETVLSRTFFTHLAGIDRTLANIMAVDRYDSENERIIYNSESYNFETNEWIKLPSSYMSYRKYITSTVGITKDKFTNFMVVSVTHQSPQYTKELLELIISELNVMARQKEKLEADKRIGYLNKELARTSINDIKNTINVLLKSQMQKKMFAEVSQDFLVNYIDYPFVPEFQSAPNKRVIVIFGVFFTNLIFILILLGYVLFKEHRRK
jgi:LPS O-antigen subunit length determinant protein (WzzB/FepE family)|tara:strand:+ start:127 stop:1017 length:891 start_codon:yes stop_codon:yes gene_type:complete